MVSQEHSPLPWHWWYAELDGDPVMDGAHTATLDDANGSSVVFHEARWRIDQDDAEFIVRACNSHYELLAALKDVVDRAVTDSEHCPLCLHDIRRHADDCVLLHVQAVIAKAEGH